MLCARQTNYAKLSDERLAANAAPAADNDDDDVAKVTVANDDSVIAEHFVCWRLDRRGAVGETALHLCMLYSKLPEFRAISVALLGIFPKLSVDYYEGDEYYGKFVVYEIGLQAAVADSATVEFRSIRLDD